MIYRAKGSSETKLKDSIDGVVEVIELVSVEDIADGPNLVTIGEGKDPEIVYYARVVGDKLEGVVRGYAGTTAKSFNAGASVRRTLTSFEWNKLVDEVYDLGSKSTQTEYNADGYVSKIVVYKDISNLIKDRETEFVYNVEGFISEEINTLFAEGGVDIVYKHKKTYIYTEEGKVVSVLGEMI